MAPGRAVGEEVSRADGHQESGEDPRRGPSWAGEGQGAHSRVPGRPAARENEDARLDHVLRRAARGREDIPRQVDRPGDGKKVREAVAGGRTGRGGDPRPQADLHRCLPRPDHPDDAQGGDQEPGLPPRRGGQAGGLLPGRPGGGAPRGARPRAERQLHRPLPRRAVRPERGAVHRHGELRAEHPRPAPGPDGDGGVLRIHRAGEAGDRPALPDSPPARGKRSRRARGHPGRRGDPEGHRRVHQGIGGAAARARDRQARPQGGAADRRRSLPRRRGRRRNGRRSPWAPPGPSGEGGRGGPGGRRHRDVLHPGGRRHHVRRGVHDAGQG